MGEPETPERPPFLRRASGALPPARCVWLALLALALYGVDDLGGLGLASVVALPLIAGLVDAMFQHERYPSLRFPDGAIATGLFLALLLPPTTPLVYSAAAAIGAIGGKHVLRARGRPLLNPAASGVVAGIALFGLAPAWWVGVNSLEIYLMVALGVAILLRSKASWRVAPSFLAVYIPFTVALRLALSVGVAPKVLLLSAIDPAVLFFGMYMVTEPRSAPADPRLQSLFGALVAFGAVFLPVLLPTSGNLVALLLVSLGFGTAGWAATRVRQSAVAPVRAEGRRSRKARALLPKPPPTPAGWPAGRRVAAGLFVFVIVASVAALVPTTTQSPTVEVSLPGYSPGSQGSPGGGGSSTGGSSGSHVASCAQDNPSISSSTLSSLHKALGPSVILSYDASTGETVFYDPVNHVTVTETDLYEDFGYAEFNGDDYAVAGCQ